MKKAEIEFHLIRKHDGGLVIHKAATLGEYLAWRENAEKSVANGGETGWASYTIVYPKASEVYRSPNRLVMKSVQRTIERILNGGKENIA